MLLPPAVVQRRRGARGVTAAAGCAAYTVSFPDPSSPAMLANKVGGLARWIAKDETVLWLVEGVPASLSKGTLRTFPLNARQAFDREAYQRSGFLQIWRTMRDTWYDEALNHRDWDSVRKKYEDAAATATDSRAFDRVVAMMLGELNGSHLGFSISGGRGRGGERGDATRSWTETTAHLGVRFDLSHPGPGLKIRDVIIGGPADLERLASLPTLDQARAMLLGVLQAPGGKLVRTLAAPVDWQRIRHQGVRLMNACSTSAIFSG